MKTIFLFLIALFVTPAVLADSYYARSLISGRERAADQMYVPIEPNHARAYPRQVVEQFLYDYGGSEFYCVKGYPCNRKPLVDRYGQVTPSGIHYSYFYRAVPAGYDYDPNDYNALEYSYYRNTRRNKSYVS